MPPRKLTTQTPGEPVQKSETTEQPSPVAEQPVADPEPAAACPSIGLPNAAEIDPKTIKKPVLTQQGYVIPEK